MVDYTPNMKLVIPVPNQTPWTEDMDGNLSIIDSVMGQFIAIPGFSGAWDNAIAYTVGQVVVEVPASTLWQCNVSHTSATAPTTFAADRIANPTYWTGIGGSGFVVPDAVKKSGDTMTGRLNLTQGVSFGSIIAANNTDGSRHILLYGTTFGINITDGALNIFSTGQIAHVIAGTIRFQATGTGAIVIGGLNVSGTIAANVVNATTTGTFGGRVTAHDIVSNTDITAFGNISTSGILACSTMASTGQGTFGGGGIRYSGIVGGGDAVGYVWTGSQLDAWVNGVRIGKVTIT